MFPYYSEEARNQLGLPDSPVIHLAITKLADKLMSFASGTRFSADIIRITALRAASGCVQDESPFECAVLKFRVSLDLPADAAAADEAYRTTRTDWLGQAMAEIKAAGIDPGADARRMATPYGWNESLARKPEDSAAQESAESQAPRTVVDEHGRTWALPIDYEGMNALLNRYGRLHGLPSPAVWAGFGRHGRTDTLRMLMLRGAEGERINLAARALALGPIAPRRNIPGLTAKGVKRSAEELQRIWAREDKWDRNIVEALRTEAAAQRERGYVD